MGIERRPDLPALLTLRSGIASLFTGGEGIPRVSQFGSRDNRSAPLGASQNVFSIDRGLGEGKTLVPAIRFPEDCQESQTQAPATRLEWHRCRPMG